MAQTKESDCPSKKPWSEVFNGSLKRFVWGFIGGFGEESGRSLGRVILYIVLAIIFLGLVGSVVDSITGWLGGWAHGWFDWLPWIGGDSTPKPAPPPVEPPAPKEPGFICRHSPSWNPFCK